MRYFCKVAYDGFSYNGYQIQKHDANTIQQTIQEALKKIFHEQIVIYGSGRTDKKVHAYGQTFHFDSLKVIPFQNLKIALNSLLPESIQIKSIVKVNNSFHARFSAHKKVYVYKIINKPTVDVFKGRYYAYIADNLDMDLLVKAATLFEGTHDFINFTTNKKDEVESFSKTIYEVKCKKNGASIEIEFYGSGFLRYQVRMMVGAILIVASKKQPIEYIKSRLATTSMDRCSYKAAPEGLYLKKVIY